MSNNCIGDVQWIVADAPSVNMSANYSVVRTHHMEKSTVRVDSSILPTQVDKVSVSNRDHDLL